MASQLLTMLLPGSYTFFDCPRAVPSEYISDPTNVKVLFNLRSRYLAMRGGRVSRGLESKDQPARTVEEPRRKSACESNVCDVRLREQWITIVNNDGGVLRAASISFIVYSLKTLKRWFADSPYFCRR